MDRSEFTMSYRSSGKVWSMEIIRVCYGCTDDTSMGAMSFLLICTEVRYTQDNALEQKKNLRHAFNANKKEPPDAVPR